MFYYNECAKENRWPRDTFMQSYGKCEMCNKVDVCNDVPSYRLPPPSEPHPRSYRKPLGE